MLVRPRFVTTPGRPVSELAEHADDVAGLANTSPVALRATSADQRSLNGHCSGVVQQPCSDRSRPCLCRARVHASAREHGVVPDDATFPVENPVSISDLDEDSPQLSSVSAPTALVACSSPSSCGSTAATIHAVRARHQYLDLSD